MHNKYTTKCFRAVVARQVLLEPKERGESGEDSASSLNFSTSPTGSVSGAVPPARSGKKVMQFLTEGRHVANVVDGKVTPYGKRRGTGQWRSEAGVE